MSELDRKARQLLGNTERIGKQGNLDRNALHVLYLLLKERSVTRTAMLVGLSQPSVSEILARLRSATGDQLLVRTGGKLELTEHARSLQPHIERALVELDWIGGKKTEFAPSTTTRTFRLGTADNLDIRFHVNLVEMLRREAPNATLETFALTREFDYAQELAEGTVDVVVANWPNPPDQLRRKPLLETEIVCIMSANHRWARSDFGWEQYQQVPHIDITPRALGEVSPIDINLVRLGVRRRIVAHYPFFSLIPPIVASTDLVFTGGRQFLEGFAATHGVVLRALPSSLPPLQYYQLWHERSHHANDCAWFRQLMEFAVGDLHQQRA